MPTRPFDEIRMVNCSGCSVRLLGLSEADYVGGLTVAKRAKLPPMCAGRHQDRPYCAVCWPPVQAEDARQKAVAGRAA